MSFLRKTINQEITLSTFQTSIVWTAKLQIFKNWQNIPYFFIFYYWWRLREYQLKWLQKYQARDRHCNYLKQKTWIRGHWKTFKNRKSFVIIFILFDHLTGWDKITLSRVKNLDDSEINIPIMPCYLLFILVTQKIVI